MSKSFIKFLILFNVIALHCAADEPVIPAINSQVRKFRKEFAAEIKAQGCQFEAIGIFVFINNLVSGEIANQHQTIFKNLGVNPLQIAEAVRLGYGFDRGVCSDLVVSAGEMSKYRDALTGIGRHVAKDSQKAEIRHVFTQNATQAGIESHLRLSNALMYKAESPSERHPKYVKFNYDSPQNIIDRLNINYTMMTNHSEMVMESLKNVPDDRLTPEFEASVNRLSPMMDAYDKARVNRLSQGMSGEEKTRVIAALAYVPAERFQEFKETVTSLTLGMTESDKASVIRAAAFVPAERFQEFKETVTGLPQGKSMQEKASIIAKAAHGLDVGGAKAATASDIPDDEW